MQAATDPVRELFRCLSYETITQQGKPSQDSQGRIKHMRYLSTLVPKPRPNRVGSQSQGRIEHVRSHSSK